MRWKGRDRTPVLRFTLRCVAIVLLLIPLGTSCSRDDDRDRADNVSSDLSTPAGSAGQGATSAGLALHRHEPQHGGVVRSVDVYHVEVVEDPLAVWLYDRRGNPLTPDGVEGQLVVYSDDERHPHALEAVDDHLAAVENVSLPPTGTAFVELTIDKQPIDVALELPLENRTTSQPVQSPDPN